MIHSRPDETITFDFPTDMPFVSGGKFQFLGEEANGCPSRIASSCGALIRHLKKWRLDDAYRIELLEREGNWELQACLEPVAWFDKLESANRLTAAQNYVTHCEKYGQVVPTGIYDLYL